MFSNRSKTRKAWKSVLRSGLLLVFVVCALAGFAAVKSLTDTDSNELIGYDSGSTGVTQTVTSPLMGAGTSDNWNKVSNNGNIFLLNQLASEEAATREELLKQSAQEMEEKLDALKMNFYPELNLSTYKDAVNQSSTASKPVVKDETFVTSGTMTGTAKQIEEWEYALSKSNEVNSDVQKFLRSVDGFRQPYPLTDYQRYVIERAVMAESGTEPYLGVVAIAQCLRESAEYENTDPVTILTKYQWTSARVTPNAKVKRAVAAVFDYGIRVTDSRIMFFYAPHLTTPRGHETRFDFVFQISKVRFFTLKKYGV
ncbi:MAG: hypothetical protein IKY44_04430, partial [Clostridia bacterium]|nr:hypothetical protein [Clostridia bacterium]